MEAGSLSAPRAPKLLLGIPLGLLAALIALVISIGLIFGASSNCGGGSVGGLSSKVPSRLVPIYEAAASRYGLGAQGPSVLAAINKVETDFGRDMGPSSAGAIGWMQFEPSTWATYGVDADGDGVKNPNDPWDAIFAAARYLRASGAPGDWQAAILAYNHAQWYVAEVLADAKGFQGATSVQVAGFGDCAAADSGPAVQRMVAEAARLNALHLPYVWGGSHGQSPDSAQRPLRLLLGGLPSAPGRRLSQPDDGHHRAGELGRTRPRAGGHDPRQALRARSPHLHRVHARGDASERALLGDLRLQSGRRSGVDSPEQLLRQLPRRLSAAPSAGAVRTMGWPRPRRLDCFSGAGLPARIVRAFGWGGQSDAA